MPTTSSSRPFSLPPVRRLISLAAVSLTAVGLTACGGTECRQQGACGPDAYCSPDYICVPLEEVAPGSTDVQRWGPNLTAQGDDAWSTDDPEQPLRLVDLSGALGTWAVEGPVEQLGHTALTSTRAVEGEFWIATLNVADSEVDGTEVAMAFIDMDQLVLPTSPTSADVYVTVCSDRYEDGFLYDEMVPTVASLRPDDESGYLLEVADVALPGALGPLSLSLWFDVASDDL